MSATYVARQPIVDRQRHVQAFEILFRKQAADEGCDGKEDQKTARVILRALIGLGIDRLTEGRPAFINVTERLLEVEGLEFILPADLVVLEVLEDIKPTPALIRRLTTLKERGFKIALDDFVYDRSLDSFLQLADYVKVDVKALSASELVEHSKLGKPKGCLLLAEKVETYDAFRHCCDLGFDLFQGWFFCKPETLAGQDIHANRLTAIQIIARLHQPNVPIDDVVRLVTLDPALSYCVLRVANSTLYSRPVEVDSIHEGVMRLGVVGLRRWIAVMLMAGLEHKPRELFTTALVRARMCESLAPEKGLDPDALFTVGLFSVLDAMFDRSLDQILGELPLAKHVRDALLGGGGDAGGILRSVLVHEQGAWTDVDAALTDSWLQALDWTRAMLETLGLRQSVGRRSTPQAQSEPTLFTQ